MTKHKEESSMLKMLIRPVAIGVLVGMFACLMLLLLFSLLASMMDIPPAVIVPLATVATACGAFASGMTSAKLSGRNGWLVGVISALILFVLSVAAGLGLFAQMDTAFMFVKLAVMLACGMVGGMVAVNSKKRKRR